MFLIALVTVFITVFISSLLVNPHLDKGTLVDKAIRALTPQQSPQEAVEPPHPASWLSRREQDNSDKRPALGEISSGVPKQVRLGFVPNDDDRAIESLKQHGTQLTHLVAGSLVISEMPPSITVVPNENASNFAQEADLPVMPMLTNLRNETFEPESIEFFLQEGITAQTKFADDLIRILRDMEAPGVVIEWEELDPAYQEELTQFLALLHTRLSTQGLQLWLCIPLGNDIKIFDLDALAPHVDRFIAMLYYETGESDAPGSIASLPWFAEWLDVLISHGDSSQWIAGIGTFGYDWHRSRNAERISFSEAMALASSIPAVQINSDQSRGGSSFAYRNEESSHTVWFLDAITFFNQLRVALARSVGGIAINNLGLEDPAIWQALNCHQQCPSEIFTTIKPTNQVAGVGEGDFLTVTREMADGRREIKRQSDGSLVATYTKLPESAIVFHQGYSDETSVAITFDDGPDPNYTPKILDILRENGAKAAFFVTGESAANHPWIIRRIVEEGHEIGNHTFTHINLANTNSLRVQLELNATQRVIENITGLSTLLFRPPYDVDRTPQSSQEIEALLIAQKLGYIPVVVSIDPTDWDGASPGDLLTRVRERRGNGNIILLHDGGGDRSNTVLALPLLLDYLKRRNDKIVPLHSLLGVPPTLLMPAAKRDDSAISRILAGEGIALIGLFGWLVQALLIAILALLFLRTIILVTLAYLHRLQELRADRAKELRPNAPNFGCNLVSIIIAAYNEEKVIVHTLNSIRRSKCAFDFEVIVVDDGSSDRTGELVRQLATTDSRIRLLSHSNQGKAESLARALAEARSDLLVTFDADTICSPRTIAELVAPLADSRIGAVSGNIKVLNRVSILGNIQYLEYLLGFNLDRRAHDLIDSIVVVPGAACSFRKSAVLEVGGLSSDTLAEDTDVTLALHKGGYKVRYAPRAVAWTEAPVTITSFIRQRKRWSFGTLQCLWKHNDLLFRRQGGGLSWFALPSIWFCHIFVTSLIPLVDLGCLFSLASGVYGDLPLYAAFFLCLDLLLAIIACHIEGEPLRQVWWIIPMRFLYRPLLGFAVISSLLRAIRGGWVSWGRQDRMGLSSKSNKPNVAAV